MTDVNALWAAVERSPHDDTAKLALADALAEADDGDPAPGRVHDRDIAHVIKLLVRQRRWPKRTFADDWEWTSGTTGETPKRQTHVLPPPWYTEYKRTVAFNRYFDDGSVRYHLTPSRTCRGQILLLTATLVRLRDQMAAQW